MWLEPQNFTIRKLYKATQTSPDFELLQNVVSSSAGASFVFRKLARQGSTLSSPFLLVDLNLDKVVACAKDEKEAQMLWSFVEEHIRPMIEKMAQNDKIQFLT